MWAVSCSFYSHPNHMEHILHSWQSFDPLEMSPLHIRGWAFGSSDIANPWYTRRLFARPAFHSLPRGFGDTSLGFPTCLSQMMVSLGVTKLCVALTTPVSCLPRRICLRKCCASLVLSLLLAFYFLLDANNYLRR